MMDAKIFRLFNFCRMSGDYDALKQIVDHVGRLDSGEARYRPYYAATLLTDLGQLDEAKKLLDEFFSGKAFEETSLLALMLEAKDYHWRRTHSPWSARLIEFPLYLYPGDKLFTALHPQNQILKYSPPDGICFTTDLHSSCRFHAGNYASAAEILAMVFKGFKTRDIGDENFEFLRSFLHQCLLRKIDGRHVVRFLTTRQLAESMLVPSVTEKVFLGAYAGYVGPRPWMVWIENWSTLFQPYAETGNSCNFEFGNPEVEPLYLHLAQANCTAIITHVRSTFRGLRHILAPFAADHKVAYVPLSYPACRRKATSGESLRILFMNSYAGCAQQFVNRGGLELIHAFQMLPERLSKRCRLTIIGKIPYDILNESEMAFMRDNPHINRVEAFLSDSEVEQIVADSDLFLIPAHSFHSCCVVQALSHGVPIIATNCWGYEEYIRNGYNGFLVNRGIQFNWFDENGVLREKEKPSAERLDGMLARNLADRLEMIVSNKGQLPELSKNAYAAAREEFSIERRNELLMPLLS